jgi:hypothetical protein
MTEVSATLMGPSLGFVEQLPHADEDCWCVIIGAVPLELRRGSSPPPPGVDLTHSIELAMRGNLLAPRRPRVQRTGGAAALRLVSAEGRARA